MAILISPLMPLRDELPTRRPGIAGRREAEEPGDGVVSTAAANHQCGTSVNKLCCNQHERVLYQFNDFRESARQEIETRNIGNRGRSRPRIRDWPLTQPNEVQSCLPEL